MPAEHLFEEGEHAEVDLGRIEHQSPVTAARGARRSWQFQIFAATSFASLGGMSRSRSNAMTRLGTSTAPSVAG